MPRCDNEIEVGQSCTLIMSTHVHLYSSGMVNMPSHMSNPRSFVRPANGMLFASRPQFDPRHRTACVYWIGRIWENPSGRRHASRYLASHGPGTRCTWYYLTCRSYAETVQKLTTRAEKLGTFLGIDTTTRSRSGMVSAASSAGIDECNAGPGRSGND